VEGKRTDILKCVQRDIHVLVDIRQCVQQHENGKKFAKRREEERRGEKREKNMQSNSRTVKQGL